MCTLCGTVLGIVLGTILRTVLGMILGTTVLGIFRVRFLFCLSPKAGPMPSEDGASRREATDARLAKREGEGWNERRVPWWEFGWGRG